MYYPSFSSFKRFRQMYYHQVKTGRNIGEDQQCKQYPSLAKSDIRVEVLSLALSHSKYQVLKKMTYIQAAENTKLVADCPPYLHFTFFLYFTYI